MKNKLSLLCVCIVLLLLLSFGLAMLLPGEHNCHSHDGCSVCLLIQSMESVLRALCAAVLTIFILGGLPGVIVGLFCRELREHYAHETPIELCDKLSN